LDYAIRDGELNDSFKADKRAFIPDTNIDTRKVDDLKFEEQKS
jgi:hypothetical protein